MEVFSTTLSVVWTIIKTWWWILLPFVLWKHFAFMWREWRKDEYAKGVNNQFYELKMPREVERPFKAMEQVLAGWWMFYDPNDWWETWWEGKYQVKISVEVMSDGGEIHFYLRFPKALRNLIESSIYAQYPEAELVEAEDYTARVPQDIPNEKWDLWGTDYELMKPDIYPLKTYKRFFEETTVSKEYQRVDPMAALLEALAKAKPGEQIWVQFIISPVTTSEDDYIQRAKDEVAKLAYRGDSKSRIKDKPMIQKMVEVVVTGKPPGEMIVEESESILPPEMKLTPGEREIVSQVELKVSKMMYNTVIRFIVLGERDKWNKANLKTVLGYFNNFNTENTNRMKPWNPSTTRISKNKAFFLNVFLHQRKLYMLKRKLFRQYRARMNFHFPRNSDMSYILNIEELASMFHIVGRTAIPAPNVQRIESKKAEPPADLPWNE